MKITNVEIMAKLAELSEGLGKVNERLDEMATKKVLEESIVPAPEIPTVSSSNSTEVKQPIPLEYTELVRSLLNQHFGVEIKYLPDQVAFEFAILVPKNYSNAGDSHWATYHEDKRSKVIQNAYGANGVREYVLQVYENFPPEIKSMITYDRAQI